MKRILTLVALCRCGVYAPSVAEDKSAAQPAATAPAAGFLDAATRAEPARLRRPQLLRPHLTRVTPLDDHGHGVS
jgi:hypothetical protein